LEKSPILEGVEGQNAPPRSFQSLFHNCRSTGFKKGKKEETPTRSQSRKKSTISAKGFEIGAVVLLAWGPGDKKKTNRAVESRVGKETGLVLRV